MSRYAPSCKPFKKRSRRWLNPTEGMAAIEWSVEVSRPERKDAVGWVDTGLSISDCSRTVSLDFYVDDPKKKRAAMKKVDLLISELCRFRKALSEVEFAEKAKGGKK